MEGGYLVEFAGPFQSLRVVSVCGNKEDITGWLRPSQIARISGVSHVLSLVIDWLCRHPLEVLLEGPDNSDRLFSAPEHEPTARQSCAGVEGRIGIAHLDVVDVRSALQNGSTSGRL